MDLIVQSNLLKYAAGLFDRASSVKPPLKVMIAKPLCPSKVAPAAPLPRITPEEAGVDSALIAGFLGELVSDPALEMHGVMILRDGRILCDAEFGAYRSNFWHAEHSLSKSVTAMAIGLLIDEGKLSLDDKVVRLLEKKIPPLAQLTHKGITVRHLLTMTSGVVYSEAGAIVEQNWLRAFFESRVKTEPGRVFHYNSMNTYVLSCIVREVSGVGLRDYLRPRLFTPLGINVMHWETAPDGNEIGGWGLYLRREDAAKLALLYCSGGLWAGKRILPKDWIDASSSRLIPVAGSTGDFDYGYQMWSCRRSRAFLFNGMFGQDALIFPDSRIVVISNAGIEQIFQQSRYYELAQRYFASPRAFSDTPLKQSGKSRRALEQVLASVSCEPPKKSRLSLRRQEKKLPVFLTGAVGKTFSVRKKAEREIIRTVGITGTGNIGLLPLIEQVLRNRYTKGIVSFSFARSEDRFLLRVTEGDKPVTLPFYPGKTLTTVLHLSDTEYHAAVTAETAFDEEGRGVLKLRLSFPEIASARLIRIYFNADGLEVRMKEMPGMGLIRLAADSLGETVRDKKALADLLSKIDPDMLYYKIKNTIEPEFRLYPQT